MKVKMPRDLVNQIGLKKLEGYGVTEDRMRHWKFAEVNLSRNSLAQVKKLETLIQPHTQVRGAGVLLKDIAVWLHVLNKTGSPVPRTCQQFSAMATEVIRRVPGHRLYRRDALHETWLAYYVDEITYVPERHERDYRYPEYTSISVNYEELGQSHQDKIEFGDKACTLISVEEALLQQGFILENPGIRADYLKSIARYNAIHNQIGRQFTAVGGATDNLDGNEKQRGGWWSSSVKRIALDRNGDPARVVIDIIQEEDSDDRSRQPHISSYFWNPKHFIVDDEDDTSSEEENQFDRELDSEGEPNKIEVPIHPIIACFDLRRHRRLRIHESQLTEYVYDTSLGAKLVLPSDVRTLVDMLVSHKGQFKDIIAGKGGGAIILCAGRPGMGKTLTAEVYSEVMSRPLYSVQCSQLGTDPNGLEDELMKTFARSQRWNAILLLDEADVYVAARGSNLQQNAIVGVFLRVLEYYSGVLFLTTNRSDLVDDAIASRCIARIDYTTPSREDQTAIWRILTGVMSIKMTATEIDATVQAHPHLSGRDVKNLLKLAMLVSSASGEPITAKTIAFVKRFKPTQDGDNE